MSKAKRKGKKKDQDDPTLQSESETLGQARDNLEQVGGAHKNIFDLTAEELKHEAFKLGLYNEGDKPRKDQALTKLTAFLSRSGMNIETFMFQPNGANVFPAPLLSQNNAKVITGTSQEHLQMSPPLDPTLMVMSHPLSLL